MRYKIIATLLLVTSLSASARTITAQSRIQNPPDQPPPQSMQDQRTMGAVGMGDGPTIPSMLPPDLLKMLGPVSMHSQGETERGRGPGGPLQRVSKLLAALDDPRIRTMLGLTDQQADGLRKIIVDTEMFTIKTGADIAVNSIELRELLRADKPDRTAVMSKGDEISKSTSTLINHYLDAMLAVKSSLTPEQQKMIRAYWESGHDFRISSAVASAPLRP